VNGNSYRVLREENQFLIIGYQFIKISIIASSDLSGRGNLGLKLLYLKLVRELVGLLVNWFLMLLTN
jgi:hypothetical protein